jgi:hypothetical protein
LVAGAQASPEAPEEQALPQQGSQLASQQKRLRKSRCNRPSRQQLVPQELSQLDRQFVEQEVVHVVVQQHEERFFQQRQRSWQQALLEVQHELLVQQALPVVQQPLLVQQCLLVQQSLLVQQPL